MSEHLAYSPEVQQWFGDFFQRIFDEGRDTPLELTLSVFMALASGQADALSGRHISDTDVPAQLLQQIEHVRHRRFGARRGRSAYAQCRLHSS